MGSGLTVACVLWMGKFRGRRYSPEWVRRLRNMVARHLDRPHRFVCLSNVDVDGVETIPLPDGLPGWWAKLALFREPLGERTLYLDLDTLITGDLGEIVGYPSPFALMPPSYVFGKGKPAGGVGVVDRYQSSCMVWDAGQGERLWAGFYASVRAQYRGDQDFIGDTLPGLDTMPPGWFRKLKDCQSGPPEGVKVVLSMPWKNDEAVKMFAWVRETWC